MGKNNKGKLSKGPVFDPFLWNKIIPAGWVIFFYKTSSIKFFFHPIKLMMLFSFRIIFIPGLIAALFISKQALSTPGLDTMGNFAQAGDHQPSLPNLPGPLEQAVLEIPANPMKAAVKALSTETKINTAPQPSPPQPMKKPKNNQPHMVKEAKNNAPPPPPSVPVEELNDIQSAPPPAPPVSQHNPQPQKAALSPSPKKRHNAPQTFPFNPPNSSANRRPQNVPPPLVELEEPAELFDYSSKVIIFYKPCKNQPLPCRRPLMTNSKDTMFKYDKNRNINISGIARKKAVKTAPPPDNMENL